ncbi:MAG: phosphatidate cytidylyltransferase [Thiomicrorhabdus sp.]|nr:MAG: phosphatidate cytidylyltransferase [Thiomicrorhabdus sp.]
MLIQRIITAVILAVVVGLALFKASADFWQGGVLLVSLIAAWEWAGFAKVKSLWLKGAFSILTMVIVYFGLSVFFVEHLAVLTIVESLLILYVVLQYQRSEGLSGPTSPLGILLAGMLSIILFCIVLIRFREEFSPELLLLSMFVIWAIDTGAYFSGRRFGKTKLAVYVSPGKTWEGVWGGTLLSFIIGLVGIYLISPSLNMSAVLFAALLAFIALFSVLGDLFESVLKRQAGLKDSGRILPGHGGVLDRVDSLLIAIPMLYLLWSFGSSV